MADVPVTTTTQILSEILAPELALAFNRETRLAQILPVRAASNANGPTWVVNTGGSIARTHGDGAAIVDFNSDVDAKASLSWGNYESPFHVTDAALSDAALSANPRATNDQFARLVSESVATLAKKIETDLFSGSGSNSIIGLDSALDNANTYAGIDRASAAYFRASEFGSGSLTTLTKAQIRSDLGVITTASGERPNVAICAPAVFCKVADLFEAQRQFGSGGDRRLGRTRLHHHERQRAREEEAHHNCAPGPHVRGALASFRERCEPAFTSPHQRLFLI